MNYQQGQGPGCELATTRHGTRCAKRRRGTVSVSRAAWTSSRTAGRVALCCSTGQGAESAKPGAPRAVARWVIINQVATQRTAFVLVPDEVRALARRGEKNGRVSYWLWPGAYDQPTFREAW